MVLASGCAGSPEAPASGGPDGAGAQASLASSAPPAPQDTAAPPLDGAARPPAEAAPSLPSPPAPLPARIEAGSPAHADPELESIRQEFLAIAREIESGQALFVGASAIGKLEERLAAAGPSSEAAAEIHEQMGREHLRLGDSQAALREFQEALRLHQERWDAATASGKVEADSTRQVARLKELLFRIVIAGMRVGEQENCIAGHTPRSCILPLSGDGVHHATAGAQTAFSYARQYLSIAPDDAKGIWFLNLAAMALGNYPDGVEEPFRIDPARFTSSLPFAPFSDVAPSLGLDTVDQAGGSLTEDLDADGFIDLVTSTMDPRGRLRYWRNDGDGTFTEATAGSGLEVQLGGLNLMQTDYDNDRDADILILRGGWLQAQGRIRKSLLRNNGDGTFTDVTRRAGLAEPAFPSQTAAWADYDLDGDLDFYVGNEGEPETSRMRFFPNHLYRNNGDGTFTDVAREAGVTSEHFAKGVAWGDYDGDRDPDLYVSNIGPNRLYRNNGDGTFTDVAPALGVTEPSAKSFATWFFDHDNDGDLDLYVGSYQSEVDDVAAEILGRRPRSPSLWPRLYRNEGNGTFTDITIAAGLDHPSLPMGANFGDLNEDGWLDFYLGTGAPMYEALMPNLMYLNLGDGRFADVTYAGGFGHLQKGHGISFADLDNDGDQDISLQVGGFFPGDQFANALFENPGHGHPFLAIRAIGTRSNAAAMGTRIRVRVETPSGERSIYRWVGTGGSFGASSLEQSIGLGNARRIVDVELYWPASNLTQRFTDVPFNAFIEITEGKDRFEVIPRRRTRLGG
jgi:hypothetical protein